MHYHKSFYAEHGRTPKAGVDFDRDAAFCEDDSMYYSGWGLYADDPAQVQNKVRLLWGGQRCDFIRNGLVRKYNNPTETSIARLIKLMYDRSAYIDQLHTNNGVLFHWDRIWTEEN